MNRDLLRSLVDFFSNHPIVVLLALGFLYFLLEILEGRSLFKPLGANSFYQFLKSSFFWIMFLAVVGAWVYEAIFVQMAEFKKAGTELQLEYHVQPTDEADALIYSPILTRGERRQIVSPVLTGRYESAEAMIFQFRYSQTESAGETISVYFRTVIAFSRDGTSLPDFAVQPKGMGDRLFAALFGTDALDFPDDPDFSRRYRVEGTDSASVRQLFSQAVRQAVMRSDVQWAMGNLDHTFIIFKDQWTDESVEPVDFGGYLAEAYKIFQATHAP